MSLPALPPIDELVPHSGAMVLLDSLLEADDVHVKCGLRIGPASTFCVDGSVPAIVALEYMAQAVAAFAGLKARNRNEPPRIGYLLGTRELTLNVDAFAAGDELEVVVRHEFGDEEIGAFDCRVVRRGEVTASAVLNVYQGAGKGIPT